jgi:hypothetical protein
MHIIYPLAFIQKRWAAYMIPLYHKAGASNSPDQITHAQSTKIELLVYKIAHIFFLLDLVLLDARTTLIAYK